jgi:hypothetical protein
LNLASLQTLTQSNTRLLEIGIVGHESKLSKTHKSANFVFVCKNLRGAYFVPNFPDKSFIASSTGNVC